LKTGAVWSVPVGSDGKVGFYAGNPTNVLADVTGCIG
jgi:hypothetical protein